MKYKKYLLLIPLATTILMLLFFSKAYDEIIITKTMEKSHSTENYVELIAAQIDKFMQLDDDWGDYDYNPIIKEQVEYIDKTERLFAAAYTENLEIFTDRTSPEHVLYPFDPFIYEEFAKMVHEPTGRLSVLYDNGADKPYDMHLFWRWIPTGDYENKLLVITGVSRHSIIEGFAAWIYWGILFFALLGMVTQIWFVVKIIRLKMRGAGLINS